MLAHSGCNNAKRDRLAAEEHLGRWVERNDRQAATLRQYLSENRLPDDPIASVAIARWAYTQAAGADALVWVEKDILRHLGPEWSRLLGAA